MPSRSPISQCGGAPSRRHRASAGSPQSRTVMVASGGPTGTSGSGGLGMRSSRSSSSVFEAVQLLFASIDARCRSRPSCAFSACGVAARLHGVAPTWALTCLRSARMPSTSPSSVPALLVDGQRRRRPARRPRPCCARHGESRRRHRAVAGCRRSRCRLLRADRSTNATSSDASSQPARGPLAPAEERAVERAESLASGRGSIAGRPRR